MYLPYVLRCSQLKNERKCQSSYYTSTKSCMKSIKHLSVIPMFKPNFTCYMNIFSGEVCSSQLVPLRHKPREYNDDDDDEYLTTIIFTSQACRLNLHVTFWLCLVIQTEIPGDQVIELSIWTFPIKSIPMSGINCVRVCHATLLLWCYVLGYEIKNGTFTVHFSAAIRLISGSVC